MKYIAHLEGGREQTVKEHLQGTAKLSAEFAEKIWKRRVGILLRVSS